MFSAHGAIRKENVVLDLCAVVCGCEPVSLLRLS